MSKPVFTPLLGGETSGMIVDLAALTDKASTALPELLTGEPLLGPAALVSARAAKLFALSIGRDHPRVRRPAARAASGRPLWLNRSERAELRGVTKRVRTLEGPLTVLDGVALSVPEGAFYVLAGRSGAGKSSLLSVAGGLDADYAGTALVFERSWRDAGDGERARMRNAPARLRLSNPAPLRQPVRVARPDGSGVDRPGRSTKPGHETLLERVGLGNKRHLLVQGLSGGERQRLTVARSLVNRPRLSLVRRAHRQPQSQHRRRSVGAAA